MGYPHTTGKEEHKPRLESTDRGSALGTSKHQTKRTASRLKTTVNRNVVEKSMFILTALLMVGTNASNVYNNESREVFVSQEGSSGHGTGFNEATMVMAYHCNRGAKAKHERTSSSAPLYTSQPRNSTKCSSARPRCQSEARSAGSRAYITRIYKTTTIYM
jgi:hypothetical protein